MRFADEKLIDARIVKGNRAHQYTENKRSHAVNLINCLDKIKQNMD